jgi:fumarate hydratase subunit alpha
MREVTVTKVTEAIASLFQQACYNLPEDVLAALQNARNSEDSPAACDVLDRLLTNAELAARGQIPLCQDTGTAVVFIELGQDVHISGGDFNDAISEGVRRGYARGYLRKSIVQHPYTDRINTSDNTPPVIHLKIVPGDRLRIIVMPKGGGGENMTRLAMLVPASGRLGIIDFVVKTVAEAGGYSCPPVIVGVGIGGTSEKVVLLAKEALLREVGLPNPEPENAKLEREILAQVNQLGIGAMGYGGRITALAVHVETYPCHIGCMPVAVNLQCHSARHKEITL